MSKALTAADILGADDIRKERVEVPEWIGHVWVRGMTGIERSHYQQIILDSGIVDESGNRKLNLVGTDIFLAACCMVDESGGRLFTDEQVDALGSKSSQALARVTAVAQRLSAITQDEVGELEGNLEGTPSADSVSS